MSREKPSTHREGGLASRYLKAGMDTANVADDLRVVNVHAWVPTVGVELGMLFLNLAVWLEAAARLAGWTHAV